MSLEPLPPPLAPNNHEIRITLLEANQARLEGDVREIKQTLHDIHQSMGEKMDQLKQELSALGNKMLDTVPPWAARAMASSAGTRSMALTFAGMLAAALVAVLAKLWLAH